MVIHAERPRRDWLYLAILCADGFVVGVLTMAYILLRLGSMSLPLTALVAGLANCGLVYLSAGFSDSTTGRLLPVAGWLVATGPALFGGPGGDAVFPSDWRTLLYIVCGVGLPALLIWSGRLPAPR